MSFIVQISPFVHLFTLKALDMLGILSAPRPLAASCAYISFYT
jgi:hypothetical protein